MLATKIRRVLGAASAAPRADRETASDHIKGAIQMHEALLPLGALDEGDRKVVRASTRRLWLALSEITRGNP